MEIVENPLRADSLMELLHALLEGLVYVGTIALLLGLVWTGAQFVLAQGSEEGLKKARQSLMWTVIGGVILLGAEGIALMLEATALRI